MQISQHTLDANARFRAACDALRSLPAHTTPLEQLVAAVSAREAAMEALAYAVSDDIAGITR